jgi:hypothetical protein
MDSERNALIAWAIFKDLKKVDPKRHDELRLIRFLYDRHGHFLNLEAIAQHFGSHPDTKDRVRLLLNDAIEWGMVRTSGPQRLHYRLTEYFYELASREDLERFKAA